MTAESQPNVRQPPSVELQGVRLQDGHVLHMTLQGGVFTFHADAQDPLAEATLREVCSVLVGVAAPRRGSVRIAGHPPHDHPATRRRIASVLGEEPELVGPTVGEHLERIGAVLGIDLQGLDPQLNDWRPRQARRLDGTERRILAAGVALAHRDPLLVVLHEPTQLGAPFEEQRMLARIRAWQEAGTTVICTTTDPRIAARLGTQAWSLSRRSRAEVPAPEYLLRSSGARALAARLADHPAVTGLRYDEFLPRDLWIRGSEADALADAIQESVLAEGCELHEMTRLHRTPSAPSSGDQASGDQASGGQASGGPSGGGRP